MKSIVKKALVTIGLVSAIATTANAAAANDEIEITGTVTTAMVAGFSDVSAETGTAAGLFIAADINLGAELPGATWAADTSAIFVKTNSASGVSMTITDAGAAAGVLKLAGGADVPVTYSLMGAGYVVDTDGAVSLCAAPNDGTVTVGDFVVTPDALAADQAGGDYTVLLNVVLAAN